MSLKTLENEFVGLKKQFNDLHKKVDDLVEQHNIVIKKYEKQMTKLKKVNFKCRKCGDKFETLKELKDHKESECVDMQLKCNECGKCFEDKKKLDDHTSKAHVKYDCDECGQEFKFEAILEKHIEAVHRDDVLYCHYFNNDKDCPFDEECIYLHEDSEPCKFNGICERKLCMYKHETTEDDKDDSDCDDDEIDVMENISVEDIRPILEKFKKSVENFEAILEKCSVKCKHCEFEAKDSNGLNMHIKAKHQNINKSQ